jgi:tRNA(Phe) wybutosine-synthesizing methylase Tyw3
MKIKKINAIKLVKEITQDCDFNNTFINDKKFLLDNIFAHIRLTPDWKKQIQGFSDEEYVKFTKKLANVMLKMITKSLKLSLTQEHTDYQLNNRAYANIQKD